MEDLNAAHVVSVPVRAYECFERASLADLSSKVAEDPVLVVARNVAVSSILIVAGDDASKPTYIIDEPRAGYR